MATPIVHGHNTESDSAIAGYFSSGEDAHRAIHALLDDGFLPSQIGAAFHTSPTLGAGNPLREEVPVSSGEGAQMDLDPVTQRESTSSSETGAGAASHTEAVMPGALIGGAGTAMGGPGSAYGGIGREHAIPGAGLENTGLPSELEHELPTNAELRSSQDSLSASGVAQYESAGSTAAPHSGSAPHHHVPSSGTGSWASRLGHLFGSKPSQPAKTSTNVTEESQNFGTGEGHMNLPAYSPSRFESAAAGAGVPAEHSRHLSRRLSRGGAIVTVSVTGRATEVERIFERHHGLVRFEGGSLEEASAGGAESQYEVFGNLEDRSGI